MSSIEENRPSYDRATGKQWKPKIVSDWAVLIGGIGLIALSLSFVSFAIQTIWIGGVPDAFRPIINHQLEYLIIGIALFILAIVGEAVGRFRIEPPAVWRVQNQLTRCLIQLGLLDGNNTQKWKGMFSVSPIGKWDAKTKRFSLPFLLRHAKATEKQFATIEQSIASFTGCRDAAIEIDNTNRIWNMRLDLWFGDDAYSESLSQDAPW